MNKVEAMMSKSLIAINDRIWYLKLMVNPLAHKVSPADYLVLAPLKRYLIECKQVNVEKNPKAGYAFDRLTQEQALVSFNDRIGFELNYAFVLIGFVEKFARNSSYFLIPIDHYINRKITWPKKSIRRSEAEKIFSTWKISVVNNTLDFSDSFLE